MSFEIGQRVIIDQPTRKVLERDPEDSSTRIIARNLVGTISWISTYGRSHPYPYSVRLDGEYFAGNKGEFSIDYIRESGHNINILYDRPSLDELKDEHS